MNKPTLIVTIDGCDPAYLDTPHTPNLAHLASRGFRKNVLGMMPTVTNVNHASILTGLPPSQHGIASNYRYDPATGQGAWLESDELLTARTCFEVLRGAGGRSALISAKRKLNLMFGRHVDISISAEAACEGWSDLFPAPRLTDPANSAWVLRVAREVILRERPDLVYVTTTDYVMHHARPEEPLSERHLGLLDRAFGELMEAAADWEVYVLADHGMSDKGRLFNLQRYLDEVGVHTRVVLPIEDRYSENHPYDESGSAYVYVLRAGDEEKVRQALERLDLVERVFSRSEAAQVFELPDVRDRIGDFFVLATSDAVFGSERMGALEMASPVRSHGSLHERSVPLIAYNSPLNPEECRFSLDVIRSWLLRCGGRAS